MTMGHAITLWGWNNNGIIFTDSDQDYTSVSNLDLQYADVTFSGGE